MLKISNLTIVAFAATTFLVGCGGPSNAPSVSGTVSRPVLTVEVTQPKEIELDKTVAASGSLFAWQEASVGAEVSGFRVVEIYANVGDYVKKGKVLARLSDDTVRTEMLQQEAVISDAKAVLAQAKDIAHRNKTLEGTRAVSEQTLISSKMALESAEAKLKVAQAVLDSQKIRLAKTTLVAPDDGTLIARNVNLGQVVSTGTELFRILRQNRLEWRAEVPAAELLQVKEGQTAKITLADGSTLNGLVRQVAPTVDATTRSGVVYVDLPPVSKAKPGMFVSGQVASGKTMGKVVPGESVVVRDGTSYVMSVTDSSRVKALKVKVGRRDAHVVEISSGLPNEPVNIVTQGAGFLKEGDLVKVVSSKGANDTAAPLNAAEPSSGGGD